MSVIIEKGQRLRADIIKHLYYKRALSLTDLSKLTKKSLPLVTAVVNGLISEGYILEQGLAPSTGGRRASIYLLNPNHHKYIVAVAMDQLITRLTIYDLSRKVVLPIQHLDLNMSDSFADVDLLAGFINKSIKKSKINRNDIIGVGIGMPGFVNTEKGINSSFLFIQSGETLRDYLSEKINLPISLDNDSSLIALAELNFGEAIDLKDVMVVNIGWGTGLGMIVNGQLYRGSRGYAGEFSHIPLSDSNNLCACGKRGCLEVDTSLLIMAEKAERALEEGAESSMKVLFKDKTKHPRDHFLDAVEAQDPLAISILSKAAFQIGKGLSTLMHILNPECIVLSGRGAKVGKMFLPSIQQAINQFCMPRISEFTTIKLSTLTDEAELLAAASLMVENSQFE
ncbi:putative NBD/HSP70 family sugar kinase [Pedobacter psychrotolerans]|uniref:Putative NBD/HSP70 family sugar kinase n=1 Tax=Pedobacter psychrotolerans TaxID=1843235 RepID=A0A4R2HK29_9SPHI|nr:ROK family protein [Pedobacter psychrotolerans]TCO28748.1 putative NBD/HSP70 family sugar kinase [Pedobacter psychrotolerans]GGE51453.1 transcriptional regulator [Pedobacter psychrotolerans]